MNAPNERALQDMITTMASCAGVTLDASSARHLAGALARIVTDCEVLARSVSPEIEPMTAGRWPESQR